MAKRVVETPEQQPPDQGRQTVAIRSGGAAAQDNLRNARLIIGREYRSRVTQRSFIISTIILLALIVIAAFVPTIIQLIARATSGQTQTQTHIVVVNQAGAVAGLDETALSALINTTLNGTQTGGSAPYAISSQPAASVADATAAGQGWHAGCPARALAYVGPAVATDLCHQHQRGQRRQSICDPDTGHPTDLFRHRASPGSDSGPGRQPLGSSRPDNHTNPESERSPNESTSRRVCATFAGAYLLFYAVVTYATAVANGVVEEKSSRVMELLLNAATPWQLLVGKIVGIGAAGLTQMVCLVVVGIGALLLQLPLQAALLGANTGGFTQYLSGVSIPFLLLFLVYFLLAYFLYATLFAGLGAMVKRQDEVQSAIQIPFSC